MLLRAKSIWSRDTATPADHPRAGTGTPRGIRMDDGAVVHALKSTPAKMQFQVLASWLACALVADNYTIMQAQSTNQN